MHWYNFETKTSIQCNNEIYKITGNAFFIPIVFLFFFFQWRWSGQANAIFNVFQTTDSSSGDYDGFGFHSDSSRTGTFKHRFAE